AALRAAVRCPHPRGAAVRRGVRRLRGRYARVRVHPLFLARRLGAGAALRAARLCAAGPGGTRPGAGTGHRLPVRQSEHGRCGLRRAPGARAAGAAHPPGKVHFAALAPTAGGPIRHRSRPMTVVTARGRPGCRRIARMTRMNRLPALAALLLAGPAAALDFTPCELRSPQSASGLEAQCATFEVPEDRNRPDGRRLQLRVARVPAREAEARPDPVVFLAGGPGQAASESFPQVASAYRDVLRDREVILVDQRGTGGSNLLQCDMPLLNDPTAPPPDAGELQRLARDCLSALDADVAHYTTRDYLADLEAVRQALGVERWNLVGGSYGTRVALSYLQAHPDSLRTVVLDGVVPQDVALGQDHGRHLDEALQAQFRRCLEDG